MQNQSRSTIETAIVWDFLIVPHKLNICLRFGLSYYSRLINSYKLFIKTSKWYSDFTQRGFNIQWYGLEMEAKFSHLEIQTDRFNMSIWRNLLNTHSIVSSDVLYFSNISGFT